MTESLTPTCGLSSDGKRAPQREGLAARALNEKPAGPLRALTGTIAYRAHGGGHIDVFRSEAPGRQVHRAVLGPILSGMGDYTRLHPVAMPFPYRDHAVTWGGSLAGSRPLALALLASCLGEGAVPDDRWEAATSWRLHEQFAAEVICPLDAAAPLSLDWYTVQSWIDQHTLGEPGPLAGCIRRVREFEELLRAALAEDDLSRPRHVDPGLWGQWDIEMLVSLCAVAREPQPELLGRFADHLLDLKFKLYRA